MSYSFNNKFAYDTFEIEAYRLNKPVNVLTFQSPKVYQ